MMRDRLTRVGCWTAIAAVIWGLLAFLLVLAPGTAAQAGPNARVRVIHTAFDAPPVDVYQEDSVLFSQLGFAAASAPVELPPGSHRLKLTSAGESDSLAQAALTVESGKTYTILVAGRRSDITTKVLEDDLSPLGAGKSRVRVVHTSLDTPAVDVALQGDQVLFPNLGYTDVSDYRTVDAATIDVELRPAGSTTAALTVPDLALEAGKVYTVYAVGLSNGPPPLSLVPVVDSTLMTTASTSPAQAPATIPRSGAGGGWVPALLLALLAAAAMAGGAGLHRQSR